MVPPVVNVVHARSVAKSVDASRNEDLVVVADPFYAVVDGATAKFDSSGESPGRRAAATVGTVLRDLTADATARSAVDLMTAALDAERDGSSPESPTACLLVLAAHRDEVWVVGDGWVAVDGTARRFGHPFEEAIASERARVLERALETTDVASLMADDVGRAAVLPRLRREAGLANGDDPSSFGRLDGRPVPDRLVQVIALPPYWRRVVLASDGYPRLGDSLEETERLLAERLERDPLMIEDPPATKGLAPGLVSFDDRSWLEIVRS